MNQGASCGNCACQQPHTGPRRSPDLEAARRAAVEIVDADVGDAVTLAAGLGSASNRCTTT